MEGSFKQRISYGEEGGGGYSFFAYLSHLTVDYDAFLSRRSTVPTPKRDASKILAVEYVSSICYIKHFLLALPYFYLAVCDHVSPRIAIVFSLLFNTPNVYMSRGRRQAGEVIER